MESWVVEIYTMNKVKSKLFRNNVLSWEESFVERLHYNLHLFKCKSSEQPTPSSPTEAEFLGAIQRKVFRFFLLYIQSHLYSFALGFLFLQTYATSYSFYCVLLYI